MRGVAVVTKARATSAALMCAALVMPFALAAQPVATAAKTIGDPATSAPAISAPTSVPASAQATTGDAAAVARTLARLRADGGTQTDFTMREQPQPPKIPEWLRALFEWLSGAGQPLMTALAYGLLALTLLFILYLTVPVVRDAVDGLIRRLRRTPPPDVAPEAWRPDVAAARDRLAEADALAGAGRYAEAVHLLLEHGVDELDRLRPGLVQPAQTARAIGQLAELPAAAASAFMALARIVERGLWAQRPLGATDWQSARTDFEQFALGDHWRGATA